MITKSIFRFTNNNPRGVLTDDCIIRSLSMFLNQDYSTTLNALMNIYKQTGYHIGDPVCFKLYLSQFTDIISYSLDNKALTLNQMINDLQTSNYTKLTGLTIKNCDKLLVLLYGNHLTYLENHVIMDIWNCGSLQVKEFFFYER